MLRVHYRDRFALYDFFLKLDRIKVLKFSQVSRPLLERSFHRKIQSRKVFTHRESFDTIIAKTEEKLSKVFTCIIEFPPLC